MRSVVVAFVLLIGVSANTSFACENWVAKVVSTNGLVEIKEGSQSKSAEIDSVVCPGQVISVAANSRAALYLSNNSFVRLDQNTVLAFPKAPTDQGFWVQLQQGVSHFISRITQRFVVDAPYVNAAVDGTEFLVSAQGKESSVSVIEGQVTASNEGGQQMLTMGQKAVATGKASGFHLTPIQTEDVIDWAIYYSPLPVLQELQASDSAPVYQELIEQAQQQRPDLALQALQKQTLTESLRVADAALLMSVGQTEKALAQIESSTSTQALALKSVIFSSRNQSEKALAYAQKAVQQDSQSSAALLALSYAHQAALNLPEALQAAHRATLLEENNAIAWARVSEMELAMGNIRQADKAIAHAQQKQPDSAYVITQAGFIKLFNIRIDSAKALFKQAIELDSENPQAHLGLGLALLRQGELKQGREQLEYATSLDPARSVVRSYLGRAYFEEKRDEEAGTQWALAKQLDPNDPTPYFYEGVRKLYANDPIGAIEELETSRKLNDERALYRSETLLQSDAASRSATLARAYDDVGYDQGVLLSGWDALKNDPTSSEGHRLLADYYRGNSRYETARASELLQSQLWQPLSAYPLQPQLSETGISVVEGSGPQNPGFNEYHSLFTQDGVYGSVTGYGGSDGTWGDDLVGSFLAGPVAVSLGQYHFETDGWRDNSDQEQDIYNGIVSWQATSSTMLQIEYRKFNWEHGDLGYTFEDETENSFNSDEERETYRIGLTHRFNSQNAVVVSASSQKYVEYTFDEIGFDTFDTELGAEPVQLEAQYVLKTDDTKLVLGYGEYKVEGKNILYQEAFGLEVFSLSSENKTEHSNAYGYFSKDLTSSISFMLGAEYDSFESYDRGVTNILFFGEFPFEESFEDDVWSPKAGIELDIGEDWSSRIVAFKSVQKSQTVSHSIEPTNVLGFSQDYLDDDFSVSKNIGISFDGQLLSRTKLELSLVDRVVDYRVFDDQFESDEMLFRSGLYFVDTNYSLGISYELGDFDFGVPAEVASLYSEGILETVPISFNYFFGGWSFESTVSYYNQKLDYQRENEFFLVETIELDQEEWVLDIIINYRFTCNCGMLRLGVLNVTDRDSNILSDDFETLSYYPARNVFGSINLTY